MEQNLNYQRIEQAIQFLTKNVTQQPDLDDVAKQVHLSPFHFQRIFTEWAGISPKKFLQFLTTEHLKAKLAETNNLLEAAHTVGLSSQSRVYDLFVTLEAVTPNEYKTHGEGITIEYGFHPTPLGECLLAMTQRGICSLSFLENGDRKTAFEEVRNKWKNAEFIENQCNTEGLVAQIFDEQSSNRKFNLLVKGTNFQIKVWQALLNIPTGGMVSYQTIARVIDNPKAVQAVGSAVGANPIAYLIPCHRVIRKEGQIGEYHWGSARKTLILGKEMTRTAMLA
ncbi:MAG: methylated-DNA--[protein]-cysteine S-methyltransferase [Saprospiraceae bacterium]|nr:methylated-DNA--[protein]-cysteine S-methyltransferase [Saprospiraceae bacterium]